MESKSWVHEPKSGTKVGDRNVDKENREYQVKKDNRNIRESVRENEKQVNDPVGSEADPKVSEMGRAIGSGGEVLEGHGEPGDKPYSELMGAGVSGHREWARGQASGSSDSRHQRVGGGVSHLQVGKHVVQEQKQPIKWLLLYIGTFNSIIYS